MRLYRTEKCLLGDFSKLITNDNHNCAVVLDLNCFGLTSHGLAWFPLVVRRYLRLFTFKIETSVQNTAIVRRVEYTYGHQSINATHLSVYWSMPHTHRVHSLSMIWYFIKNIHSTGEIRPQIISFSMIFSAFRVWISFFNEWKMMKNYENIEKYFDNLAGEESQFQVHICIGIFGTWNANERSFLPTFEIIPPKSTETKTKLWDRLYD